MESDRIQFYSPLITASNQLWSGLPFYTAEPPAQEDAMALWLLFPIFLDFFFFFLVNTQCSIGVRCML